MKKFKHSGWVYVVSLEHQELSFGFQTEQDALNYCKDKYPNTVFQILPIPVFVYEEIEQPEKRRPGNG